MTRIDRAERSRAALTDVAHALLMTRGACAAELITGVLTTLRTSFGADSGGFYSHETNLADHATTTALFIAPEPLWELIPFRALPTALATEIHPGVRHFVLHRARAPFAITDVVSEREWLGSELGSAMRPDWGRNHQLAIPNDDQRSVTRHAWILGRTTSGFTAADRDVAHALQPLLDAVNHHYVVTRRLPGDALSALTPREQAVAALLAEGCRHAVIARRLAMSLRTAHKHTERIYRKLDIHDRAALRAIFTLEQAGPSIGWPDREN